MVWMLRRRMMAVISILWLLVAGGCAATGLLASQQMNPAMIKQAWFTGEVATAVAVVLLFLSLLRQWHVKLPPHRRVFTQAELEKHGADGLTRPYVYPNGQMHVNPSILSFPHRCACCNGPSMRSRRKVIGRLSVHVPFCEACNRWTNHKILAVCVVLLMGTAAGFIALIEKSGRHQAAEANIAAGLLLGLVVVFVAWFLGLRHLGIPVRFRRYSSRTDSAFLYCRKRAFRETMTTYLRTGMTPSELSLNDDGAQSPMLRQVNW
jgi:hypothetical protein